MAAPKIDNQFWYDKSEEIVNNSLKRLNSGLDNLNKYFTALWAIYIVASIFTIEYIVFTKPQYYFVIIVPHILLFLGRWVSLKGQLPKTIDFAYNVPKEIEDAYITTYNYKRTNLGVANFISMLATIAIVAALIFSFKVNNDFKNKKYKIELAKKEKEEEIKNRIKPNLQMYLTKDNNLIFSSEINPNSPATIEISGITKKDTINIKTQTYLSSSKGMIYDYLNQNNSLYESYNIKISWVNKLNIGYTISKYIKAEE